MELLTQLNKAMEYIEENITDEKALSSVSNVTMYSSYHFQRIFNYIADMPLSEYIRRRKMSLAAMELQESNVKIIDLAVKYGYDSADSFTRAFVKQHGITPTLARKSCVNYQIYPPLTFQIQIRGVQKMNWRIEEREAFEVFGIERFFKNDESDKIPEFWDETREDGSRIKLVEQASGYGPMAICGHIEDYENEFPYIICCEVREGCNTDGFKVVQVPKATWAVFRAEGMKDHSNCQIPELFKRAYREWLPSSGYNKAPAPDMEIYGNYETGEIYEEVWIPVVKK